MLASETQKCLNGGQKVQRKFKFPAPFQATSFFVVDEEDNYSDLSIGLD